VAPKHPAMTFLNFFKRVPGTPISLRIFKKEFQIRSGDRRIVFDEEYHVPSCPLHLPPKVVITDAAASAVRMRPLQSASVNKGFRVLTALCSRAIGHCYKTMPGRHLIHMQHLLLRFLSSIELLAGPSQRFASNR
jgi:hypothetical protein